MGFFKKIIDGLKKTQQNIGFQIKKLFKVGIFNDDFYENLEEILLTSDVGAQATEEIVDNLKEKIRQTKTVDEENATRLLKEALSDVLGDEQFQTDYPCVILVVGVNGVGKTTTIGKLARNFVREGKSVVLAAADTFRAAAGEQLEIWAKRADVRIIKHEEGSDPAAVVFDALSSAKSRKTDVVIVDTAGRLHNKKNLMEELKKINRIIDKEFPDAHRENLVVLDGTTGQNALSQAREFGEVADLTGIILTKMDGTAKGGIAVAIQSELKIPVKYIGVGETIEDLQKFDADQFVDALFNVED